MGHPSGAEEHVVGVGKFSLEEGRLKHSGKIRNTARHPDVVEQVKDGFLGPSIHARGRVSRKEGKTFVENLRIDGVGLVAFQGVKDASIDYAISESFDKRMIDLIEQEEKHEVEEMDDHKKEEPMKDEGDEVKFLKEELALIKEQVKKELIGKIVEFNSELKEEDLGKKSSEELKVILEYESRLSKTVESVAVVETPDKPEEEKFVESGDSASLTEDSWKKFNTELKSKLRGV